MFTIHITFYHDDTPITAYGDFAERLPDALKRAHEFNASVDKTIAKAKVVQVNGTKIH